MAAREGSFVAKRVRFVAFLRRGGGRRVLVGMSTVSRLFLILLFCSPAWLAASTPLDHVRRARALLGGETWAQLLRVENVATESVYPEIVYALVFELGGLLWFYTDTDGTQSFSLHRDNLAAEKADFAPLLRAIDPGFVAHTVLDEDVVVAGISAEQPLPNGCLIESYAALRERALRGEIILGSRLLSYHVEGRRIGHTVLVYETPQGPRVIDPVAPDKARRVKRRMAGDAVEIARWLQPEATIARARWVPVLSALEAPMLAALGTPPVSQATDAGASSRKIRSSSQLVGS